MKKILSLIIVISALLPGLRLRADEPSWLKYITPTGYLQAGFSTDQDFDNTFYIQKARVAVKGTFFDEIRFGKLEYTIMADFAKSPKLVDGFFKYTLNDYFGVQVGQFRTPLSIENSEYSSTTLEFIDYSLMTQRFVHLNSSDLAGIAASGRDIGLQFYGKLLKMGEGHHLIRYNVGMFNGSGMAWRDDDKRKDFIARLMVYPLKDLAVSGYYLRTLGPHPDIAPEYNDYDWYIYDRYGGGVMYDSSYGWLRAEYMAGHTHGYRAQGAYGSIGGRIGKHWEVGLRYDYFDANTRAVGGVQQYYTGCVNWKPWKFFKLQLNYSYRRDLDVNPTHFVNLMATVKF